MRLRRKVIVIAVLGVALPFVAGWAAWRDASAGGADPYDTGSYWGLALGAAVVAGVAANTRWVALTAPLALIAYPFWNTPALADEANSPFGALGVVFLILYLPVLAGVAWLGAYLRRSWDTTRRPSRSVTSRR